MVLLVVRSNGSRLSCGRRVRGRKAADRKGRLGGRGNAILPTRAPRQLQAHVRRRQYILTFLLPSLTIRERATPIVRSRPSSVHADSVWFKRTSWETRNTTLKNHAEAQFIIAGGREPSERSASY